MTKAMRTSLFFSLPLAAMLLMINLITSPSYLWCLYPVFVLAWWPLTAYYAGRQMPLHYALSASFMCTIFFVIIYKISSPGAHPWFLYPIFAVWWWPLSVWGKTEGGAQRFAVAATIYSAIMLLTVNLLTSPSFWWWVYPSFLMLWWPIALYAGKKAASLPFAVGSSIAVFLFLLLMHRLQTPRAIAWYLFAALPLAWWPICRVLHPRIGATQLTLVSTVTFALYFAVISVVLNTAETLRSLFVAVAAVWVIYAAVFSKHKTEPSFAFVNAVLMGAYFVAVHRLMTPGAHPWHVYTFFPLLLWPVTVWFGKKLLKPRALMFLTAAGLLSYGAINYWISPGVPWIIFLTGPAVVVMQACILCPKKQYRQFANWASAAIILYFSAINILFTPHAVWAVYPAFAVLWWPLSMHFYYRRKENGKVAEGQPTPVAETAAESPQETEDGFAEIRIDAEDEEASGDPKPDTQKADNPDITDETPDKEDETEFTAEEKQE